MRSAVSRLPYCIKPVPVSRPNPDGLGELREVIPRNPAGAFYRIYQPNKWRLKHQQAVEAAAKVAALVAA